MLAFALISIVLEIFPTSLILSGIFPTIIIPVWDFSQYKFELLLPSYKGHDAHESEKERIQNEQYGVEEWVIIIKKG